MKIKNKDVVTDEQIDAVWGNAYFGDCYSKRDVVDSSVLKCAAGYYTGHTAQCIVRELKLVTPKNWRLTKLGREYLYGTFAKNNI